MLNYFDIGLDHLLKAVDSLASKVRLTPFESLYLDSKDDGINDYSNIGLSGALKSIGNLGETFIENIFNINPYNLGSWLDQGAITQTQSSDPENDRYSWGVPESSGTSLASGMIYPVIHDSKPVECWYKINQGTAGIRIQYNGNNVIGSTSITTTGWGTTTSFSVVNFSKNGTLTLDILNTSGSPNVFAVLDCEEI